CIKLCKHTGRRSSYFTNIDQNAIFDWKPCAFNCWFQFLLNFNLLNKIKVGLLANGHVYLLQRILLFSNPHASCKGEILWILWKEIQTIAIVVADVKTIHQIIFVI